MPQLVLLRHGESVWNRDGRFTGWTDVDLTSAGAEQAHEAGRLLRGHELLPDVAFTSVLKRAIRTLWVVLDEMDRMWLPVTCTWRLNERHYGALQGKDKAQVTEEFGAEQVRLWRRSLDVRPPLLDDVRGLRGDPRYAGVALADLSLGESLADTAARLLPCWHEQIAPALRSGRLPLVVAHGNSLRALIAHLEHLDAAAVLDLEVPTGVPLLYELDEQLDPTHKSWLKA